MVHHKNMKVCYYLCDQATTRKSRGIWVYTNELITTLVQQKQLSISALTSLDGPRISGVENRILPIKTGSIPPRMIVDHLHPFALPMADIYHYPKGFMPFFSPKGTPRIASILDTIGVHYYEQYNHNNPVFKPFELEYWLAILTRTLKQADAVITISHTSAKSIRHYCDTRAIKPPPIFVTHLASKYHDIPVTAVNAAKQDYVIHFASDLPHKKTGWLLDTWNMAQMKGRILPELRLVGKLGQQLQAKADTTKGVITLPHLDDEQLKLAVIGARLLIYPSEIEGFGLPALEAYQLGTPAMFVAETSVDEIMKIDGTSVPGRFYLDFDDFWRSFDSIMNITAVELACIQKAMYSNFSWDKTADATRAVYDQVVS
jgi:glycosyltransferase involved in cell wall biosynthesis